MNTPFQSGDVLVGDSNSNDCAGIPPGDEGDVLTVHSGAWASRPASGGAATLITAYREDDGTLVANSIVVVADSVLKFDVGANEVWRWTAHLPHADFYQDGLRIAFSGPTAPTAVKYYLDMGDDDNNSYEQVATAFDSEIVATSVMSTGSKNYGLTVHGLLINGANAGTVQLKYAEGVESGDSHGVQVLKCADLIAQKLSA